MNSDTICLYDVGFAAGIECSYLYEQVNIIIMAD